MKINYEPTGINNFHNSPPICLVISGNIDNSMGYPLYTISKGRAKKLADHFCGIKDCRCPGGAVVELDQDGTVFGIRTDYVSKI